MAASAMGVDVDDGGRRGGGGGGDRDGAISGLAQNEDTRRDGVDRVPYGSKDGTRGLLQEAGVEDTAFRRAATPSSDPLLAAQDDSTLDERQDVDGSQETDIGRNAQGQPRSRRNRSAPRYGNGGAKTHIHEKRSRDQADLDLSAAPMNSRAHPRADPHVLSNGGSRATFSAPVSAPASRVKRLPSIHAPRRIQTDMGTVPQLQASFVHGGATLSLCLLVLISVCVRCRHGRVDEADDAHGKGRVGVRWRRLAAMRWPMRWLMRWAESVLSRARVLGASVSSEPTRLTKPARLLTKPEPAEVSSREPSGFVTPRRAAAPLERVATPAYERFAPPIPALLGSTSDPPSVLSASQLSLLRESLPVRFASRDWHLGYSTEQHGVSLRTFYSRLEHKGPSVLIVLDGQRHIFGAFVSESWRQGGGYFGSGETFLFKAHPHFQIYRWARSNSYFVHGSHDCVAFGGGSHFALYLDADLEAGSSYSSTTFGNQPLASATEFRCVRVEVWTFA